MPFRFRGTETWSSGNGVGELDDGWEQVKVFHCGVAGISGVGVGQNLFGYVYTVFGEGLLGRCW